MFVRARQASDLLRPHERRALCDAYGAADWPDLTVMLGALPCRGCFVPTALRPPGVPWPVCECMTESVGQLGAASAVLSGVVAAIGLTVLIPQPLAWASLASLLFT